MRTLLYLFLALALVHPAAFAADAKPYTRNVAIVVYDGVEILDFGGPSEVFAAAGGFGRNGAERAFRTYTVGPNDKTLISQGFIRLQPEFTIDNAPKPDIIVIPGGQSNNLTGDPKFMAWAKKAIEEAEVTLTVCTGAFVPAKLGVLDNLDVTTYYNAIEGLRREAPKARVHDGRRFVDNGKIVTTAGVSAGIDGSLHVVARLLGRLTAEQTAQYMEYKWSPESYLARGYEVFNPSFDETGRAMQNAGVALSGRRYEEAARAYRAVLASRPNDPQATFNLGQALIQLKAYGEAGSLLMKAAAAQPQLAGGIYYDAACAFALAGQRQAALDALGKAVANGYKQKQHIEEDPDLESLRQEPGFKKLVASL